MEQKKPYQDYQIYTSVKKFGYSKMIHKKALDLMETPDYKLPNYKIMIS